MTKDSVSVKNDNLFTATGDYVFVLSVLADGKPVCSPPDVRRARR